MKKHFFTVLFALLSAVAMAIPAKSGMSRMITLADGSMVKVSLVGDEFEHFWVDSLGNRYIAAADGNTYIKYDIASMASSQHKVRRMQANRSRVNRLGQNTNQDAFKGTKKGLIILVEFTDVKFQSSTPQSLYNKIANELNYKDGNFQGSVKDYFLAQSRGQFELDFDVVGPVQLSHNMAYYGGNDSFGNDLRPEEMVKEACRAVDDEVNFADYDWSGNGEAEQVYILYAGYGEADSGRGNTIWPHEWQLSGAGTPIFLDNIRIDTYACSNELDYNGKIAGIGTICHEFSHCMGIPDLYDTEYSGNFGMGPFDLLCSGSYNGDGFVPAGYTAYERMISGWLQPVEIRKGDKLTVEGMKGLADGGEAYKIVNSENEDEYYMVENRTCSGWDQELPAFGVMVTHVDYDKTVWENNSVNTTDDYNSHQRMTIFHADNDDDRAYFSTSRGGYLKNTYDGDLYPYQGNDSLSATSLPANSTYTANADGKRYMDIAIRHIALDSDGLASMEFGPNSYVKPVNYQLFKETFDGCSGTGGNDGLYSGNSSIGSGVFIPDNAGWTASKSYGASKCARFGTSSIPGTATTPSFVVDGTATLTFRAAPWGMDNKTLNLEVVGNGTVSPSTFTMSTGSMRTFTATITGSGTVQIKFKPSQRFFLDDVVATNGSTAINAIHTVGEGRATAIYTTNGTRLNKLTQGINIVRYEDGTVRKIVKK